MVSQELDLSRYEDIPPSKLTLPAGTLGEIADKSARIGEAPGGCVLKHIPNSRLK